MYPYNCTNPPSTGALASFNENIWNMQLGGCRLQFPLRKTQRSGCVNDIASNEASQEENVKQNQHQDISPDNKYVDWRFGECSNNNESMLETGDIGSILSLRSATR
jgi:hypothetical protein